MSFGDWEMFRVLVVSLREHELTSVYQQDESRSLRFTDSRERKSKFILLLLKYIVLFLELEIYSTH